MVLYRPLPAAYDEAELPDPDVVQLLEDLLQEGLHHYTVSLDVEYGEHLPRELLRGGDAEFRWGRIPLEVPEDGFFVPYATFVADEYYFLDAGAYVGASP